MSRESLELDSREWHLMDSSLTARLPTAEMHELEGLLLGNRDLQLAYWELCTLHADLRFLASARQSIESVRAILFGGISATDSAIAPAGVNGSQVDAESSRAGPGSRPESAPADAASGLVESGGGSPVLGFLGTAVNLAASWLASPKVLALTIVGCLATYFIGLIISIAIARLYLRNHDAVEGSSRAPARIIAADAPRWQDRSENAQLPAGTSRLAAGSVQLEFDGGARVRIEGPAEFAPQSGQRMQLTRGRLTAYVPRQARGFTVVTPTAELVDLGTEFGVDVDAAGSTDVHVLKGRIEVHPVDRAAAGRPTGRPVAAGQAVRISALDRTPVAIEFSAAHFEEAHPAKAATAADDFLGGAPIWLGNLFDDPPGTRLVDAVRSDTFKAVPKPHRSLGVERTFHNGSFLDADDGFQNLVGATGLQIAPHVTVDLENMGWLGGRTGAIANDAYTRYPDPPNAPPWLAGGISTRGTLPIAPGSPKIEEGIGMPPDALLTFDLDEIRAAGDLAGRKLVFECPRAGFADHSTAGAPGLASVYFVVFVSDDSGEILSATVNGRPVRMARRNGKWWFAGSPGKFLGGYDELASFVVPLGPQARYLSLVTTLADKASGGDFSVWSGACLKVVR